MGLLTPSQSHSHPDGYFVRPSTQSRSKSDSYFVRPSASRPSSVHSDTHSRSHSYYTRSSSYYKRRPRDGYIQALIRKIKRLIRELYDYARQHPMKVFLMVVMPLISGGALAGVARQFGFQLPPWLSGSAAMAGRRAFEGYYGSRGYDAGFGSGARSQGDFFDGGPGVEGLWNVAKMFM